MDTSIAKQYPLGLVRDSGALIKTSLKVCGSGKVVGEAGSEDFSDGCNYHFKRHDAGDFLNGRAFRNVAGCTASTVVPEYESEILQAGRSFLELIQIVTRNEDPSA